MLCEIQISQGCSEESLRMSMEKIASSQFIKSPKCQAWKFIINDVSQIDLNKRLLQKYMYSTIYFWQNIEYK